ncbi:MAG: proteasome accessory factor PafA2 family protein, partial [Planctomycetaceae bacterium]|nr:proteasome accessory factor PafA2 family protein [Planctomycetaceae bacterium]
AESSDASDEARDILSRWEEVLKLLESNPEALVGRLDWVTKRFLLRQTVDEGAELSIKKKVDIKYHELSPDGYYRQLQTTGVTRSLLPTEAIERATESPPQDTPATVRHHYLQKLIGSSQLLRVNWDTITVGHGWNALKIELRDPPSNLDDTDLNLPTLPSDVPPSFFDEKDVP